MIKARYTIVLKTLMDDERVKPLLDKALSTYPMYTPKNEMLYSLIPKREELNKKLLNHYKYREIGFETVGRFLDELQISMEEIMPYYYQLFKSQDIMNGIEDPFGNVDITEKFEQETEGKTHGTTSGTAKADSESKNTQTTSNTSETDSSSNTKTDMQNNTKNVESSTPQNLLDIGTKNINGVDYADKAGWNEDISNSTGETSDNAKSSSEGTTTDTGTMKNTSESSAKTDSLTTGKTTHTFTKQGNQGVNTYAHDMKELREIFLNIEKQIIEDERISELFMRVY